MGCIGIIRDKEELLKKYIRSNDYDGDTFPVHDIYCDGSYHTKGSEYDNHLEYSRVSGADKGTIITIKLDMGNTSISLKINDKHYGVAYNKVPNYKYRLAITTWAESFEFQYNSVVITLKVVF